MSRLALTFSGAAVALACSAGGGSSSDAPSGSGSTAQGATGTNSTTDTATGTGATTAGTGDAAGNSTGDTAAASTGDASGSSSDGATTTSGDASGATTTTPSTSTDTGGDATNSAQIADPVAGTTNTFFETEADGEVRCNDLTMGFESLTPTVILLVDRSKSMFVDSQNMSVREQLWEPLYDALMNPTDGVVPGLAGEVAFGFAAFNGPEGGTCPTLDVVASAKDNSDAIDVAYSAAGITPDVMPVDGNSYYKWDTPTGESVTAITEQILADPNTGPKHILLVTDGNPDRCGEPDPQCGQDDAIAAVQAAFAAGITSYVVGIGDIVASADEGCWGRCGVDHLQDIANAGTGQAVLKPSPDEGTGGTYYNNCFNNRRDANGMQMFNATYTEVAAEAGTAPYFTPEGRDGLRDSIAGIIKGVRPCTFTLNEAVVAGKEDTGTVRLDDTELVYGDAAGWSMNGAQEVVLNETACQTLRQAEQPTIDIFFPCEAYLK